MTSEQQQHDQAVRDRATDYRPEGRVYDPDIGVWVWPRDPAPINNPPERPAERRTGDRRRTPQTAAAPWDGSKG
jgi:hypothetical protein